MAVFNPVSREHENLTIYLPRRPKIRTKLNTLKCWLQITQYYDI